jgi:hypothetical protein
MAREQFVSEVVPRADFVHSHSSQPVFGVNGVGAGCHGRHMTPSPHTPDFRINRPGSLIAALPAVLGFVPEKSLVLATIESGELGCVLRTDLSLAMREGTAHLAEVAAAGDPHAVIAVIVDADGADCVHCHENHATLAEDVAIELSARGIELLAVHVVDRIDAGGRWHCADGCGRNGVVEDPYASPLALAAVLDGRRLYKRRADLQAVVAADPVRAEKIAEAISAVAPRSGRRRLSAVRADINAAITAAARLADGRTLTVRQQARIALALTDTRVRDTLYALAIGETAGQAESLWAELSRSLPAPWRVEALVQLAFSAYVRGDGPLAGIALDAALRCIPTHRMASMLDTALQSGMPPDQVRELALTGYRQAERLGVQLPPRRTFGDGLRSAGA